MSTVFMQIINGELPCYKIYEDDKVFAFLDNNPVSKGHTLVIPKVEVDKIYDLDDEIYMHLMKVAKSIAKNIDEKLGQRTLWKVIGTDVPHAHIHLMPLDPNYKEGQSVKLTPEEYKEIQDLLKID